MKKKGLKRSLLVLMLAAVPLVSAEPISLLQENPRPARPPVLIRYGKIASAPRFALYGIASWYSESDPNIHLRTANGEIFDDTQMTCASWDFEFGTYLKIKNLENGKSVICRVNDRGPSKRLNRRIDLTKSAFRRIADPHSGLIQVSVSLVRIVSLLPFREKVRMRVES